jgi:hypothetical protein
MRQDFRELNWMAGGTSRRHGATWRGAGVLYPGRNVPHNDCTIKLPAALKADGPNSRIVGKLFLAKHAYMKCVKFKKKLAEQGNVAC